MLKTTKITDPELYSIVEDELERQKYNIEMIASESSAPTEILELMGCVFVNKTEEGLPGKRYQAGSEHADRVENLCIERAKKAFGCEYVNVQSYSGATANYTVFNAILNPGDKILAMRLDHGGHLTHGSSANFASKIFNYEHYGVDPQTEMINYDEVENKALEFKPKLIIAGASAYPRLIDYKRMREEKFIEIMKRVVDNAKYLAKELEKRGFRIVSGGTDNHIVLVDLRGKKITGKQFDQALEKIGITVNKNTIPNDPESPFVTSGVRIGLTAASERGFGHGEIEEIADIMQKVADNIDNEEILKECKAQARNLASRFPLYPEGYFED